MMNENNSRNNGSTFMTWGEAKQVVRIIALLSAVVVIALLIPNILGMFKGENAFVGSWKCEGYNGVYFTFYSDGTCEVYGEYGTCQWNIVDEKLKIINFYGQTQAYDYEWQGSDLVINGITFTKIPN